LRSVARSFVPIVTLAVVLTITATDTLQVRAPSDEIPMSCQEFLLVLLRFLLLLL
jgi:hypothetical protein